MITDSPSVSHRLQAIQLAAAHVALTPLLAVALEQQESASEPEELALARDSRALALFFRPCLRQGVQLDSLQRLSIDIGRELGLQGCRQVRSAFALGCVFSVKARRVAIAAFDVLAMAIILPSPTDAPQTCF